MTDVDVCDASKISRGVGATLTELDHRRKQSSFRVCSVPGSFKKISSPKLVRSKTGFRKIFSKYSLLLKNFTNSKLFIH